jgi:hypothetical protein
MKTLPAHQRLLDKAAELANSRNYPGKVHQCPICGGELHVFFVAYGDLPRKRLAVNLQCSKCLNNGIVEFASVPDWAEANDAQDSSDTQLFTKLRQGSSQPEADQET